MRKQNRARGCLSKRWGNKPRKKKGNSVNGGSNAKQGCATGLKSGQSWLNLAPPSGGATGGGGF